MSVTDEQSSILSACRALRTQLRLYLQSQEEKDPKLAKSLALIKRSIRDILMGRTQPAKPAIKKIADELSLKVELDFFEQHRKEWYKHHAGKFALIKETTLYGFYDSDNNAYKIGIDILGNISFLIK